MLQTRRPLYEVVVALAITLLASGCLVGDDKCGEHQIEDSANSAHACICAPGYVLSLHGYGCDACGAHQEVVGGKCACKKGYARSSDSVPCLATTGSEAGSDCGGSEQSCTDPNPYCVESEAPPYCTTQGCTRNDDCPMDWRCTKTGDQSFCQKTPAAFGKSCASGADCESEAPYCETLMSHLCIINDCLQEPGKCLSQTVCCDLSSLIGQSLCVPKSTLTDGKCFGGADPVTP